MKIYSIFRSIDGEVSGHHQGAVTTFVRMSGCNLRCTYCDAEYAQTEGVEVDVEEIVEECHKMGSRNVTITGGEPLFQMSEFKRLATKLMVQKFNVCVETNGTIPIPHDRANSWVVDVKMPSSGEWGEHSAGALAPLTANDFVKFVVGNSRFEFNAALTVIRYIREKFNSEAKMCFSPILSVISPNQLIEWVFEVGVDAIISVQLHKILDLKEAK